jgi:hypothetical protein
MLVDVKGLTHDRNDGHGKDLRAAPSNFFSLDVAEANTDADSSLAMFLSIYVLVQRGDSGPTRTTSA